MDMEESRNSPVSLRIAARVPLVDCWDFEDGAKMMRRSRRNGDGVYVGGSAGRG